MKKLAGISVKLFRDESGIILSAELVLVATVLVIGVVAGLVAVRDSVVTELGDVATGVGKVNQSYSYGGIQGHSAITAGTVFSDRTDFCSPGRTDDDPPQVVPSIIINPTLPGGVQPE